jgi:hypothetical protein
MPAGAALRRRAPLAVVSASPPHGAAGGVGRRGAVGAAREAGGAGDAGLGGLRGVPRRRLLPGPPSAGARHRGPPRRGPHLPGAPRRPPPAGVRRAHGGVPGRAVLRSAGGRRRRRGQEPVRVRQGRRRPHRHQGHAGVCRRRRHRRQRRRGVRRGAVQHAGAEEALRTAGGRRKGEGGVVAKSGHDQGAKGEEGTPRPGREQRRKIAHGLNSYYVLVRACNWSLALPHGRCHFVLFLARRLMRIVYINHSSSLFHGEKDAKNCTDLDLNSMQKLIIAH